MRFLVLQLARFGDIIQSKRLIKTLEKKGETHICVDASLADLARLVYPASTVHALPAHGASEASLWAEGLNILQALQAQNFDAVYNLNYSPLNRAITCLFEPEKVHGYYTANGQALRDPWVGLAFRWMKERRTSPLNLVDFWAHFTFNPIAPELVNPPASPKGQALGIVLSGQNARRSLEPALLVPIIRALHARLDCLKLVLLGSNAEKKLAKNLMDALPQSLYAQAENLVGKTDFAALAQALQGLRLLISPDTGTAHLAAHLGVPVLGLFCSSASAFETGPYGLGHYALQANRTCAPCIENRPCVYALPDAQVPCKAPFKNGTFLSQLQKVTSSPYPETEGLVFFTTSFDNMGLLWEEKAPEPLSLRNTVQAERRALLAAFLGKSTPLLENPALQANLSKQANLLFEEKDFMFPPYYKKRGWM